MFFNFYLGFVIFGLFYQDVVHGGRGKHKKQKSDDEWYSPSEAQNEEELNPYAPDWHSSVYHEPQASESLYPAVYFVPQTPLGWYSADDARNIRDDVAKVFLEVQQDDRGGSQNFSLTSFNDWKDEIDSNYPHPPNELLEWTRKRGDILMERQNMAHINYNHYFDGHIKVTEDDIETITEKTHIPNQIPEYFQNFQNHLNSNPPPSQIDTSPDNQASESGDDYDYADTKPTYENKVKKNRFGRLFGR